ncbi:unnamed protein product [Somion occarium]|uniref:EF-hand domain-containing protein n=1 Tax=Somion occarium TaxID=3059160 RepID=A0ABP1D903_9APHY
MSLHHSASHHSQYRPHSARPINQSISYGGQPGYGGQSGYSGGQYAPPQYVPQGPPPGADPQLWQWFSAVDTDRSGAITVNELQAALVNGNWTRFDLDTVKMLMNIFDTDRSGTIGFAGTIIAAERLICMILRTTCQSSPGYGNGLELAQALRSFGYNLSPTILALVEQKYASGPTGGYGPPPGITFDRFVRACVVVKTLSEAFQQQDSDRDGWITINYEQFMKIVLAAP